MRRDRLEPRTRCGGYLRIGTPGRGPKAKMHEDQLDIDVELVRSLIANQFPRWSDLVIDHVVPSGTVNAIFRVGDPREVREGLTEEARAACEFAEVSLVPCPKTVALGDPRQGIRAALQGDGLLATQRDGISAHV